jgi:hypothetical protein
MTGRLLRIMGIVLLGLTAVITLLSGIGTTCVALDATRYDGMESIADYRWLYLLYVAAGVLIGALGIRATVLLVKGRRGSYRAALMALVLGAATGLLHMATSRALRGSSMPTDFVVYVTAATLAIFLAFRIPGIWRRVALAGRDDEATGLGAGVAMIVAGITILTVQYWAGPSHSIGGVNYAASWGAIIAVTGWLLSLGGSGVLAKGAAAASQVPLAQERSRTH